MSYSYAYNPKVSHPNMLISRIPQMKSGGYQKPFYFGGSQVPTDLFLKRTKYDGSYSSDDLRRPTGRGIKVYIPKQKYYVK